MSYYNIYLLIKRESVGNYCIGVHNSEIIDELRQFKTLKSL